MMSGRSSAESRPSSRRRPPGWRSGCEPRSPPGCRCAVVAVLAVHQELARSTDCAFDHDAGNSPNPGRLRPVGRDVVAKPGARARARSPGVPFTIPCTSKRKRRHRALRARGRDGMSKSSGAGTFTVGLADAPRLTPSPAAICADRAAPGEREDARDQEDAAAVVQAAARTPSRSRTAPAAGV